MRVAVLRGGRSSEREVSLRSGAAVIEGLRQAGHEPVDVVVDAQGRWSAEGAPVVAEPAGGLLDADVAFPVLHGPFGEDGTVQGLLECLDVPYVGSDVLASAACIDKLTLKRLFAERGLPQVGFADASEDGWADRAEALGLPLWVKPSRLGSSVGISRVDTPDALAEAVGSARAFDPRVIIEAHSAGREIECSVLGNDELEVSVCGEIMIEAEWYDFEAKYQPGAMRLDAPAALTAETSERVREMAAEVYRAAGCAGLARCDFFVEDDGAVLVNEINTLPGFTETSVYAKLFDASGLPYAQLVDRLVGLALERHAAQAAHRF